MNVEISLCSHRLGRPLAWRPYSAGMRFEGLYLRQGDTCAALYRCGEPETSGTHLMVRQHGLLVVDEPKVIELFCASVAAYPVFVPATLEERTALNEAARDRQIPHEYFANGIGFRSIMEAMLIKMAA